MIISFITQKLKQGPFNWYQIKLIKMLQSLKWGENYTDYAMII